MGRIMKYILLLLSLLAASALALVESLPLSTKGRWIVDAATGQRVKLRCANWPGHMPAVIPEGLNHKPVDEIAKVVASLGFNCIRLTWSVHMVMKPQYKNLKVKDSLLTLNLTKTVEDVRRNNPQVLDKTVIEAFDEVVRALGDAGVMVILDNHVSKPMWCCNQNDGNGFFGDFNFDIEEWVQALQTMAHRFRGAKPVIAMSMRNELRGKNSSWDPWYQHMGRGAMTIHAANPNVLVIVSGLNFDGDLSALRDQNRPFPVQNDKIVFEAHWYAFSEGKSEEFEKKNPNWYCPGVTGRFDHRIGYVMHQPGGKEAPLFISEFGLDQYGKDNQGNVFLPCYFAFAADRDIDWAIWALQGSYYWRSGNADFEETYGVLNWAWMNLKDPDFPVKYRLLLDMIFDPSSKAPIYQIIFHPMSGRCLWADEKSGNVELRDCAQRSHWNFDGSKGAAPVKLLSGSLCLTAQGVGQPVKVTSNCGQWKTESQGLQMSVSDAKGQALCLDWSNNRSPSVVTKPCMCVGGETCNQGNPQVQWFKAVNSNIAADDAGANKNKKVEF